MPGITRNAGTDVAGGPIITGSPTVYANEKPVVRVGDIVGQHGRPPHARATMATGSTSVFANNKKVCKEGDIASCGHPATGSSNVFVGDNNEFESFKIPEIAFVVEQADVDFITPSNSLEKESQSSGAVSSGIVGGIVSTSSSLLSPSSIGKVDDKPPPVYVPSTSVVGDFGSYNQDNIPYDTLMLTDKTSLAEFTTKAALWGNQPSPKGPTTPYTSDNPNRGDNKFIKDQYGLTVPQILTNLANLAKNVYEPIKARYPRVIVTNTFRQGPPGAGSQQGQHGRGQAMDLVFPGYTTNQYYDIAVWIRDNLPFDQLLQEKAGSKIWIHVSYYGGTGIQVPKQNKVANLIVSPYQFVPGLAPLA